MEYLQLVRDTFGSRDDIRYRGFLEVMKDYKKGTYVRFFPSSFYFPLTLGFVLDVLCFIIHVMDVFG